MWDMFLGGLLVLAVSIAAFAAGLGIARHASGTITNGLAALALLSVFWFAVGIHGTLALARLFPFANVMVVGNWIPVGAALLAGLLLGRGRATFGQTAFAAVLLSLAWYTVFGPLGKTRLAATDNWSVDGVCLQTIPSSCSACSAAMLLRTVGIRSSEAEMIELCLTSSGGTPTLGLYRGLKLKTKGTPWDVQVVHSSLDEVRRRGSGPVLLLVNIPQDLTLGLRSASGRGQARSPGHAVVFYGFTASGSAIVGDPASGRRTWTAQRLKESWRGEGLRLVNRDA
jgi:hypothetical protein